MVLEGLQDNIELKVDQTALHTHDKPLYRRLRNGEHHRCHINRTNFPPKRLKSDDEMLAIRESKANLKERRRFCLVDAYFHEIFPRPMTYWFLS